MDKNWMIELRTWWLMGCTLPEGGVLNGSILSSVLSNISIDEWRRWWMECTLMKSTDSTEMRPTVDMVTGRATIQKDPNKLEE